MDLGTICLIVLGGSFYLVYGILSYRIYIGQDYLYCPRCGQHMLPIPFENRFLRSLFKFNRTCNNLQCRIRNHPSIYRKVFYAFLMPVFIWVPFYILLFRQSVIQETIMVIYTDLVTALSMAIALVVMWFFYRHKIEEHKKLNLDVI